MTPAESLLSGLKVRLGITTDYYDARLVAMLEFAQAALTREGLQLGSTSEDNTFVIEYAAWLWAKRDSGGELPRMLRWAINNRIFGDKAREATAE